MSELEVDPTSDRASELAEQDPKRWIALGVIATAQLMVILDASIINIALPKAQAALHISTVQPPVGDHRLHAGLRRSVAAGAVVLPTTWAANGCSSSAWPASRLPRPSVASLRTPSCCSRPAPCRAPSAAILAPAALSLITVTFTETKERATAFGVYGAISGGGAAIGLIVGGVLTQDASWRWCLLVNVPIAAAAAFGAVVYVHESKAPGNTKYDLPGAALVVGGLVSLVYGFTEAAKTGVGWLDYRTLIYLALAVVLLAGSSSWN